MSPSTALVGDLHVHTRLSDGEFELREVPKAARTAEIESVAITDHDRIHPDIGAPIVEREGIELIRGIELRVETERERLDLLGYGVEPTPELSAELERIQADRLDRGREIIARAEDRLGVDLAVEVEPGLGRPHIARAIAESDADYGYEEAFEELIGDEEPLHVVRDLPGFDLGVELLAGACAVVSLAHPLRYEDPEAALSLAVEVGEIDAVERYYEYGRSVDIEPVERAIEAGGLLATGGSDAHHKTLGGCGLDRERYEAFRARLE